MYLGYIEESKFKPSLPLARMLTRLCNNKLCCITLNWEGEKRSLYGKVVVGKYIIKLCEGLTIVVNLLGEPLGWGLGVLGG